MTIETLRTLCDQLDAGKHAELRGWLARFESPGLMAENVGHGAVPILAAAAETVLAALGAEAVFRIATFTWFVPGPSPSAARIQEAFAVLAPAMETALREYFCEGADLYETTIPPNEDITAIVASCDPTLRAIPVLVRFAAGEELRSERFRLHVQATCNAFFPDEWPAEVLL